MKKLYCSENRVMIYLLKAKLEAQHIACFIKNEDIAGAAAGEIPPVMAKPELWIMEDEEYTRAQTIVNEELNKEATPGNEWQCPQCKERIAGQFNICWQCGTSRP